MWLKHREDNTAGERRYDSSTLRKVTALAARLQSRQQETVTAGEMESIGAEVGLDPAIVREALAQLTVETPPVAEKPLPARQKAGKLIACWWATGWRIPMLIGMLAAGMHAKGELAGTIVFLGMLVYLVPGIILTILLSDSPHRSWLHHRAPWHASTEELPTGAALSRSDLLEVLFALQGKLEGQKQRRAFLSVDVVSSFAMKQGASELAVEYSFGKFRSWVEDLVRVNGGEMQSAAGDGVMCVFPTEVGAVRTARQLQEGIPQFNGEQNRLAMPFRIRCGVSAGEVAIEAGTPLGHLHSPVIDRAAALQKRAEPGDIVVGSEVTGAALLELGSVAPLPESVAGEPAFSWRAGAQGGPAALPERGSGGSG